MCVGPDATQIGPLMGEVQEKLSVFGRGGPFTHGPSAVDIAGKAGAFLCGSRP
jgi:hypothetical protein